MSGDSWDTWAKSSNNEKCDINNGLLLCPNHDALFDSGYISFNDDGEIIISEGLTQEDKKCMGVFSDMKIELKEENRRYMEYHRKEVLIKKSNYNLK